MKSCNQGFAAQSTTTGGSTTGANPASGVFAAYTSTSFPALANTLTLSIWENSLLQSIVVPSGVTSAVLTWSNTASWSAVADSGALASVPR